MKKTHTLKQTDIFSRKKYQKLLIGGVVALSLGLASCTDTKNCDNDSYSYADGNGSTAYDVGTYQDANDYGGDRDVTSSGDSNYACDSD